MKQQDELQGAACAAPYVIASRVNRSMPTTVTAVNAVRVQGLWWAVGWTSSWSNSLGRVKPCGNMPLRPRSAAAFAQTAAPA